MTCPKCGGVITLYDGPVRAVVANAQYVREMYCPKCELVFRLNYSVIRRISRPLAKWQSEPTANKIVVDKPP